MTEYGQIALPGRRGAKINCLPSIVILEQQAIILSQLAQSNATFTKIIGKHSGCGSCADPHCCRKITGLIPIEAVLLCYMNRPLITSSKDTILDRAQFEQSVILQSPLPVMPNCIFLDKDLKCSIYAIRPTICAHYWIPSESKPSDCAPSESPKAIIAGHGINKLYADILHKLNSHFILHPLLFYFGMYSALAYHMGWMQHPVYQWVDRKHHFAFTTIDGGKQWTRRQPHTHTKDVCVSIAEKSTIHSMSFGCGSQ